MHGWNNNMEDYLKIKCRLLAICSRSSVNLLAKLLEETLGGGHGALTSLSWLYSPPEGSLSSRSWTRAPSRATGQPPLGVAQGPMPLSNPCRPNENPGYGGGYTVARGSRGGNIPLPLRRDPPRWPPDLGARLRPLWRCSESPITRVF